VLQEIVEHVVAGSPFSRAPTLDVVNVPEVRKLFRGLG
jgi:hypothetical protein